MFGFIEKKKNEEVSENFAEAKWHEINRGTCLLFTFKGIFTEKLAVKLTQEWQKLMQESKEEKVCIICDCLEMKDYDTLARITFQKTLKEFQKRIQTFWVVSPSKVVKYGGMIMEVLTGFPIKTVEKMEDVKPYKQQFLENL